VYLNIAGQTGATGPNGPIDDLSDVSAATPVQNQPLIWDGTNWQSGPFNQYLRLGEAGVSDYVDLSPSSLIFHPTDGRFGSFDTNGVGVNNGAGSNAELTYGYVNSLDADNFFELNYDGVEWANYVTNESVSIRPFGATAGQVLAYNDATDTFEPTSQVSGFRNLIINGDMRISQRGTTAVNSGFANNVFGLDRWATYSSLNAKLSMIQSTVAPGEFAYSTLLTSLAATTPSSDAYYGLRHFMEGLNTAYLGWGTASAKTVTLSFWVRSSIAGTYTVSIKNPASSRMYTATYTITTANTWEKEIITIPGETSGSWSTNNTESLSLWFDLGSGADAVGAVNSWKTSFTPKTSGGVNWISTNGATFYLTGVQLEANTQPTPFEQRPYGVELALCQRYFHVIPAGNIKAVNQYWNVGLSGGNLLISHSFPVTMRVDPTAYTSAGSGSHSFDFYQYSAGSNISRVLVYQSGQSTTTVGFKTLAYSSDNNTGNQLPVGYTMGILNTAVWVSAEL
jgi:hypothetical protein